MNYNFMCNVVTSTIIFTVWLASCFYFNHDLTQWKNELIIGSYIYTLLFSLRTPNVRQLPIVTGIFLFFIYFSVAMGFIICTFLFEILMLINGLLYFVVGGSLFSIPQQLPCYFSWESFSYFYLFSFIIMVTIGLILPELPVNISLWSSHG